MDFIELLKSFGLEMENVANALGIDMQTLNNMDQGELLNLLTQQSNNNWNDQVYVQLQTRLTEVLIINFFIVSTRMRLLGFVKYSYIIYSLKKFILLPSKYGNE